MKKILVVFGTRPEAIKMCPVVNELKSRPAFETVVCVTGQHREMLDQVLEVFSVVPDHDLNIMKSRQSLFDITVDVLTNVRSVLEQERPDVVLVHGDTTTTFATSLAAFFLRIPVGHVEAGLRTYNIHSPYPEEFNRQATDAVTSCFFAPTQWAAENLRREGRSAAQVVVTGNTVIDALAATVRDEYAHPVLDWAQGSRLVLLTAHRRESLGEPMRQVFTAIRSVVDRHSDVKVVYPIHRNPAVREVAEEVFGGSDRIRLIEPLDVFDFHNFMARSYLILTDSGGIQEEAPSLGKPVLVLRDTTERPEGVEAGTLRLTGTEERAVAAAFEELLEDEAEYQAMSGRSNPYGDGQASRRIADFLEGL
ncbi:MAG: UDP-N-acetylglucosamine 2-epimerase (non-hydrolyzing) [Coriobacteriales bacterium]|nr:UDP-N-acetylglucosamine 2-epimerase (non-hydrolyzing) [Coriobacteriales bacterium]